MNADHQNHATQVSPIDQMLQMMSGFWISRGIYIAAKLGLADHLRDDPLILFSLRPRVS